MEVLQVDELENYGARLIDASLLLVNEKPYRIGPSFAKKWKKQALDFCQQLKRACFIIEYANYFGIWVQSDSSTSAQSSAKKNSSQPQTAAQIDDQITTAAKTQAKFQTKNKKQTQQPPKTRPQDKHSSKHSPTASAAPSSLKNTTTKSPPANTKSPPAKRAATESGPIQQRGLKANQAQSSLTGKNQTFSILDQTFTQTCQSALIDMIGPMGSLFVKKVLDKHHSDQSRLTTQEFIILLCKEIPDPEKAMAFRKRFMP